MKVFNACALVIRRRYAAFLIYLVIFTALSVVMTSMSVQQNDQTFNRTKTAVAVVDRDDGSPLSQGLIAYLAQNADLKELPDDKEALQDALFFRQVSYILVIPAGFSADFAAGGSMRVEQTAVPGSASGTYMNRLVEQYLSAARLYQTALPGLSEAQRLAAVSEDLKVQAPVEKKRFGGSSPVDETFAIYYRMMGYILMVLLVLTVSNVMMVFNRPDLRMRNLCAPIRPRTMNLQLSLCTGLVGAAFWCLTVIIGFLIYGGRLGGADPRTVLLMIGNSFVYLIVALSLSFLVSLFIRGGNVQNAVANFLALALSFLGGAFVPLELLGDGILTVSRFTPTFWYTSALEKITALTRYDWAVLAPVVGDILVQLGFAAAFFSVALVLGRLRRQSSSGFAPTATEMNG